MSDFDRSLINELHTLRDFLRWATTRLSAANLFYGHGNEDAFNDALQLILHCLSLPTTEFPDVFVDARLTKSEKEHIISLIQKRVEDRIPVPYLTNEAWFAGFAFYVDERVLIPRSPFAELIHEQFTPWLIEPENTYSILDMCTGSACIAIACAETFPQAQIDAVDISQDALDVATINISRHQLTDRVHAIQSDLWSNLTDNKYDLIVCNPPYVGADEMATLPDEYNHEPRSALEAEDNGLALVEKILLKAAQFMSTQGLLFVEVGNSDNAVAEKWPNTPFLWLEFEHGGHGVFMLTYDQCLEFSNRYSH
jgi:ribosomal protein L3 glutamine methyltransferase